MRLLFLAAFLYAPTALLAQLDSDTLTVTASRVTAIQADQVSLQVTATATSDVSLDIVLAALQGTGITAANLQYVSSNLTTGPFGPAHTTWSFRLTVDLAKLGSTLTVLDKIQKSGATANPKLDVIFTTSGLQASPELLASKACAYPTLLSYARTQAEKVAAAAGLGVGLVVGLSDTPAAVLGYPSYVVPVLRFGDFSSPWFNTAVPPTCSLTVQFQLLQ